jgi:hypothetical protein
VRVFHDLALLDFTILLEQTGHLSLVETGMDSGDEEVGSRVNGTIFVFAIIFLGSTIAEKDYQRRTQQDSDFWARVVGKWKTLLSCLPVVLGMARGSGSTSGVVNAVVAGCSGGSAALIALIAGTVICPILI